MLVVRHFSAVALPSDTGVGHVDAGVAHVLADGGVIVLPAAWPAALAEPLAAALPQNMHDLPALIARMAAGAAQNLRDRQLLSDAEAEVFVQEAIGLMTGQIAALLPETAPVAVSLQAALAGAALPDGALVAALDGGTAQAIGLLEAQRRYRGEAPPHLLLSAQSPQALDIAARRFDQDMRRVAGVFGAPHLRAALTAVMDACDRGRIFGFDPARVPALARAVRQAQSMGVPDAAIQTALACAEDGAEDLEWLALREDDGPAPSRVTLALPDALMEAALTGHGFLQGDDEDARHADAGHLVEKIAALVWHSGAPEIFFADRGGACALAKALEKEHGGQQAARLSANVAFAKGILNLLPFAGAQGVDVAGLQAAVRVSCLWLAAQGAPAFLLGLTNIAPALMTLGQAYDSAEGRSHAAGLAALVTAQAAETMAQLAARAGTGMAGGRQGYAQDLQAMAASFGSASFAGGDMARAGVAVNPLHLDAAFARAVAAATESAIAAVRRHGVFCAPFAAVDGPDVLQALVDARAPGLMPQQGLIECDPVGDLVFGGALRDVYRRRLSPCVPAALQRLGYSAAEIDDIHFYAVGHGTLFEAPRINHASLRAKGFDDAHLARVDAALAGAASLSHALNAHVVGHVFCVDALGLSPAAIEAEDFDLALALGFDDEAVAAASLYACGAGHLQGAPHLRPEHLAVFDTEGAGGLRGIDAPARLRMQAALEPFLAGGVAQVLALHPHIAPSAVQGLLRQGWQLGLRSLSLYRSGCGLDAPTAAEIDIQDIENYEEIKKPALLTLP